MRTTAANGNGNDFIARRYASGTAPSANDRAPGEATADQPLEPLADRTTIPSFSVTHHEDATAPPPQGAAVPNVPVVPTEATSNHGVDFPSSVFFGSDSIPYEIMLPGSADTPLTISYAIPTNYAVPTQGTNGWVSTYLADFKLKEGKAPDFTPDLKVTSSTLADLVKKLADPEKTLFITDPYNYDRLKHLGRFIRCDYPSVELVRDIMRDPKFGKIDRVVGIGGCAALDVAKAVAVDKECIVLPTILSTNCVTKNRSVIGGGSMPKYAYQTATPKYVIVSLPEIMQAKESKPYLLQHWSMSGWGDFFAKISAMIDQETDKGNAVTMDRLRANDSEVIDGLDWVEKNFKGYDDESTQQLSRYVHNAGLKVIEAHTNDNSVGGEHKFYYAMMEKYNYLRHIPSHGQIVAVGTLITAKAHAEATGDDTLYKKVRSAFDKLGIPITYTQLRVVGITRPHLESSIRAIGKPDIKKSFLGEYFKTHSMDLLDDIFLYDGLKNGRPLW